MSNSFEFIIKIKKKKFFLEEKYVSVKGNDNFLRDIINNFVIKFILVFKKISIDNSDVKFFIVDWWYKVIMI